MSSVFVMSPGSRGIHIRSLLYVETLISFIQTEMKMERKQISYSYPLAYFEKVTEASSKLSTFIEVFDASMSQRDKEEEKNCFRDQSFGVCSLFRWNPIDKLGLLNAWS